MIQLLKNASVMVNWIESNMDMDIEYIYIASGWVFCGKNVAWTMAHTLK